MKMMSLFLRNLVFTIIQPGLVAGLAPYWILGSDLNKLAILPQLFHHYLGIVLVAIGLYVMLSCIIRFATDGRGTLSPADPTKKLVIKGLYRYSRNPMYAGVMLILIGESTYYMAIDLWIYSLIIFIAFYLFILLLEEPRLRRDFGDDYREYSHRVRRWL